MTAPAVRVDVSGALARLSAVMKSVQDLSPVFAGPINQSLNEVLVRQFDTEGAYGGKKWAPHAPVTKLLRKRRGHGRGGILRDTNKLWASLTKLGLGPDAVKVVRPDSLLRGSSLPYALATQLGFTSKTFVVINKAGNPVPLFRKSPKKIPARPMIPDPMPGTVVRSWEGMIAKFIAR